MQVLSDFIRGHLYCGPNSQDLREGCKFKQVILFQMPLHFPQIVTLKYSQQSWKVAKIMTGLEMWPTEELSVRMIQIRDT